MADTQSILQLGIEAARSGDKAEARELFRLVTREEPSNSQGWLWLAGVAEDREEKRAALERVVQIEPGNELARKGLAALGGVRAAAAPPTPDTSATTPIQAVDASRATPAPAPTPPRTVDEELADSFDSIDDYAAAPESGRARVYDQQPQAGGYVPPDFGDDDYDLSAYQNQPRVSAADLDQPERDRDTVVMIDDEDRRRRSGIGAWLPLLLALLFLGVLAFFLFRSLNNNTDTVAENGAGASASALPAGGAIDPSTAAGPSDAAIASDAAGLVTSPGAEASGDAAASVGGEAVASGDAAASAGGEAVASGDAAASAAPSDAAASAPAPAPSDAAASAPAPAPSDAAASAPAPAPSGDVAGANPAIVGNDQVLTAGQWEFTYSGVRNFATGSYGGAPPSRGRYEIVLIAVRNNTGAPAQIPDGFFVLKDAQGRVYDFNRAASVDYINRFGGTGPGGAGDYAADTQIAPGAPLGSIPLLFDVAPDATNLVLFSRDNTSQGFLVRQGAE